MAAPSVCYDHLKVEAKTAPGTRSGKNPTPEVRLHGDNSTYSCLRRDRCQAGAASRAIV